MGGFFLGYDHCGANVAVCAYKIPLEAKGVALRRVCDLLCWILLICNEI